MLVSGQDWFVARARQLGSALSGSTGSDPSRTVPAGQLDAIVPATQLK